MFYVWVATEIASISVSIEVISTSGFSYCFYFRFALDSVVSSRTMSMVVEVDRACPATLPQPLRSPWYHFLSQSYNYFRYTSAILEFMREAKCRAKSTYTPWIPYPQNIGTATEIASISVSGAKLLVLPFWGTVSTSGLYLMMFYVVWRCRRKCKGIGRARKLCRSRWGHVEMSLHRLIITTSVFGFRFVFQILKIWPLLLSL